MIIIVINKLDIQKFKYFFDRITSNKKTPHIKGIYRVRTCERDRTSWDRIVPEFEEDSEVGNVKLKKLVGKTEIDKAFTKSIKTK